MKKNGFFFKKHQQIVAFSKKVAPYLKKESRLHFRRRVKNFIRNLFRAEWWKNNFNIIKRILLFKFLKKSAYGRFVWVMKYVVVAVAFIFLILLSFLKEKDFSNYIDFDIPKISANEKFIFNVKNMVVTTFDQKGRFIQFKSEDGQEEIKGNNVIFKVVEGEVSSDKTGEKLFFKGEDCTYDKLGKLIYFPNAFYFQNEKGWSFKGRDSVVDIDKSTAMSNAEVFADTDLGTLQGEGFYMKNKEVYIFKGKVSAVFYDKETQAENAKQKKAVEDLNYLSDDKNDSAVGVVDNSPADSLKAEDMNGAAVNNAANPVSVSVVSSTVMVIPNNANPVAVQSVKTVEPAATVIPVKNAVVSTPVATMPNKISPENNSTQVAPVNNIDETMIVPETLPLKKVVKTPVNAVPVLAPEIGGAGNK